MNYYIKLQKRQKYALEPRRPLVVVFLISAIMGWTGQVPLHCSLLKHFTTVESLFCDVMGLVKLHYIVIWVLLFLFN